MKPKTNGATKQLQERYDDYPELPELDRSVMKSLAYGDAAANAWRVLGTNYEVVHKVCNLVRDALTQALQEVNRPSIKDEREDYERLVKLAKELKLIIKTSMPGENAWCDYLKADNLPRIPTWVGWHSLSTDTHGYGYPLAIADVLDWAIEMATMHVKRLPPRSVSRPGAKPKKIQAFVRLLAWKFSQEYGKEMRGTIGHIATAVFDLTEPLDAKTVEGILKDRPKPFKPPT